MYDMHSLTIITQSADNGNEEALCFCSSNSPPVRLNLLALIPGGTTKPRVNHSDSSHLQHNVFVYKYIFISSSVSCNRADGEGPGGSPPPDLARTNVSIACT